MTDESLAALREAFADIDKSGTELREKAREAMLEMAGRSTGPQTDVDED